MRGQRIKSGDEASVQMPRADQRLAQPIEPGKATRSPPRATTADRKLTLSLSDCYCVLSARQLAVATCWR